jgi:hypothetical protein
MRVTITSGPCPKDALKKAYRREALKWHPDRHPVGNTKVRAESRFKLISEVGRYRLTLSHLC